MPTFGEYETVEQLDTRTEPGHVTTVWRARKPGSADGRQYAIKCYYPRRRKLKEKQPEDALQEDRALNFLVGVKDIKKAQSEGGRCLAPVHVFGVEPDGAWYATDYYPRSLADYIDKRGRVDSAALRHVVYSVVTGCLALKRSRELKYSHGNLKPSNVLLAVKGQALRKTPLHLADPHPAPLQVEGLDAQDRRTAGELLDKVMEAADLRAIGKLILQLVEARLLRDEYDFNYPVPRSAAWDKLGKDAEHWRDLCNRLLDPKFSPDSLEKLNLESLEQEQRPSTVVPKLFRVLPVAVGVGLVAVLAYFVVQSFMGARARPRITISQQSLTVSAGEPVIIQGKPRGAEPLSIQWQHEGTNLPGQTGATLQLTDVRSDQAGAYGVVVSNRLGSFTSATVMLNVTSVVAPTISAQPQDRTVTAGREVEFTVGASGTPTPSYQWSQDRTIVPGATSARLQLRSVTTKQAGSYTVLVKNSAGSVTSLAALLTVNPAPVAPTITSQPTSQAVNAGQDVEFTVGASGTPTPSYQWSQDRTIVPGATSARLQLRSVTTKQAGSYTVLVKNSAGSMTSLAALLTVNPAPVAPTITSQPTSQAVNAGQDVEFTVGASGTPTPSYQWSQDRTIVPGATSARLQLRSVTTKQAGSYTVLVKNSAGSVTSLAALLTVNPAPVAPTITSQPTSQAVNAGQDVEFTVGASGTPTPSYQWSQDRTIVPGATSARLQLRSVTTKQAGSYTVLVKNSAGSMTSSVVLLTVNSKPASPQAKADPVAGAGKGNTKPTVDRQERVAEFEVLAVRLGALKREDAVTPEGQAARTIVSERLLTEKRDDQKLLTRLKDYFGGKSPNDKTSFAKLEDKQKN